MRYYLIGDCGRYRIRDERGKVVPNLPGEFWVWDVHPIYTIESHRRQGDKMIEISEEQLALYKLGASPEGDIDG